jgi:hypothetical protein
VTVAWGIILIPALLISVFIMFGVIGGMVLLRASGIAAWPVQRIASIIRLAAIGMSVAS